MVKYNVSKSYFEMRFHTEDNNVLAACFSPEKWVRLNKCKQENTSCVIFSVVKDKETDYKLANY